MLQIIMEKLQFIVQHVMGSYYMGEVCSNGFTAHKL